MKSFINHYAILAERRYDSGYYFVTGYKTLPTLRKYFKNIISQTKNKPHDKIILVARDYDKNIIKIYEKEV